MKRTFGVELLRCECGAEREVIHLRSRSCAEDPARGEALPRGCAERFVRSIKEECLNKMILFGEDQAIETGEIVCSERLGGLLKFYSRAA